MTTTTSTSGTPSTIASSALTSATPSVCSRSNLTQFPSSDPACAVANISGIPSNTTQILESCCKSAGVEKFNGACGYYCLSLGQEVAQLQGCFQDQGVKPSDIYCNAKSTEEAKGDGSKGKESKADSVNVIGVGMLGMLVLVALAGVMV